MHTSLLRNTRTAWLTRYCYSCCTVYNLSHYETERKATHSGVDLHGKSPSKHRTAQGRPKEKAYARKNSPPQGLAGDSFSSHLCSRLLKMCLAMASRQPSCVASGRFRTVPPLLIPVLVAYHNASEQLAATTSGLIPRGLPCAVQTECRGRT